MFKIEHIEVDESMSAETAAHKLVKEQGKYKTIGSGSYAMVYGAKNSPIVYKVGDAEEDEGYMSYLKVLSKQKKQNPFAPVIYGVRIYTDYDGRSYFVVAMERLKPVKGHIRDVIQFFQDTLDDSDIYDINGSIPLLGITVPKPLQEMTHLLDRAGQSCRHASYDFHCGNFMMRDKQLVVTDPLA